MSRSAPTREQPLRDYRARRRFDTTTEPRGGTPGKGQGYSFVVQKHDARRLHYDFRLELDGVLKSWAVTRGPSLDPTAKRLAVRVEDHPLEYGTFEGTIPEGEYGGGSVMLWDRGRWTPDGDPHDGLEQGKLKFTLDGTKLHGKWALIRMRARGEEKRENWLLIKEDDEFADPSRDVLQEDRSVASGRSIAAIAQGGGAVWSHGREHGAAERRTGGEAVGKSAPKRRRGAVLAAFIEPALATLVDAPPPGGGWIYEIKYDGYRAEIAADADAVRIYSRSGLDWTDKFPPIAAAVQALGLDRALLDTEIVALDEKGRSDFGLLQRFRETQTGELACFAFDLLVEAGRDLRKLKLIERKQRLRTLLDGTPKGQVYYSEDFSPDEPAVLLAESCRRGLEGLIAKRSDAPYRSGRGPAWLKLKCGYQQEFVIIGWSHSARRAFSSILLAVREGNALRYAGRVGSGFSDAMLERLSGRFAALATERPAARIPAAMARDARFVAPEIVAEIRFAGWTQDNLIRQGHLLGIREDKPAEEVTREVPVKPRTAAAEERSATRSAPGSAADPAGKAVVAGIALSHPQKPLYRDPVVTKLDVARYLDAAGEVMARYAAGRFVSLLRCPNGQGGKGFFQRHPHAGLERYWRSLELKTENGHERYLYFDDRRALVEAAQMDTLEFHIWGSRVDDVERPDRIVFDLDPAPDVSFDAVKAGAREVRAVLQALGLESLPLISGGKGIHVVVPITPRGDWATVKHFAGKLAARLSAAAADRYVATMTKSKRQGRIFIDYFRNDRTASAVAPFSPRNRPGAPVAWPLTWDGLADIRSADAVSIYAAMERLAPGEDPWGGYARIRQSLTQQMVDAVDASGTGRQR